MTPRSAQKPVNGDDLPDDGGATQALFLAAIAQIVEDGCAVLTLSSAGARELRLASGEIFQLGDETLTRIA